MDEFVGRVLQLRGDRRFSGMGEFESGKKLGSGGFSECFEGRHLRSGETFCLKKMDLRGLDTRNFENLENEVEIHRRLKHPNIVELIDWFVEGGCLILVLEICRGGSLFRKMNLDSELSESDIVRIFSEVCRGIEAVHSLGVIQRDIKPENVLIAGSGAAKICDFGWAVGEEESIYNHARAGTCAYMSPEALQGKFQKKSSDIWSLGVLLYEMFHNVEPFPGSMVGRQLAVIRNTRLEFDNRVSGIAKDLMMSCLREAAETRPTIQAILSHPFITSRPRDVGGKPRPLARSIEPQTRLFNQPPAPQPITPSPVWAAPAAATSRLRNNQPGRPAQPEKTTLSVDSSRRMTVSTLARPHDLNQSFVRPAQTTFNSFNAPAGLVSSKPENLYSSSSHQQKLQFSTPAAEPNYLVYGKPEPLTSRPTSAHKIVIDSISSHRDGPSLPGMTRTLSVRTIRAEPSLPNLRPEPSSIHQNSSGFLSERSYGPPELSRTPLNLYSKTDFSAPLKTTSRQRSVEASSTNLFSRNF